MSDHYTCKGCGADPRYFEPCTCHEKPLFIPMKAEYFWDFNDGSKTNEYRLDGPRWNAHTCSPGRAVTLSLGYGKEKRLRGRVRDFSTISFYDLPTRWRRAFRLCYGPKLGRSIGRATIARIGIDVFGPRFINPMVTSTA